MQVDKRRRQLLAAGTRPLAKHAFAKISVPAQIAAADGPGG
jgi:hypothetical protein